MFGSFLAPRMMQYDSDDAYSSSSSSSSSSPPKKRWKDSGVAKGLSAAGSGLIASGQSEMDNERPITPVAYERGGKVRKTGMAKVHKNERVIPAGKRKKVERLMRKAKMRMKARA